MIHILFVVPYPELEPIVKEIYDNHPRRSSLEVEFKVMSVDQVREYTPTREYDVMVGRNFTVKELRTRYPKQAILDIPITGYDIVRAIYESRVLYGAKKVAVLGSFFENYGLESLEEITECELINYPSDGDTTIGERVVAAKEDGCDCIIGGYSVYRQVRRQGMNGVIIKVGRETIYNVFDEAIHIAEAVQQERERTNMFSTVAEKTSNGIFYVNYQRKIAVANEEGKGLFPNAVEGANLAEISREMDAEVRAIIAGGEDRMNRLHDISNLGMISADYTAVRAGSDIKGVLISFQSVEKIQQLETKIRRKLSDKGFQAKYSFHDMIYRSDSMGQAISAAKKYAAVSSNILIIGETGTGKELFAQSIHNASDRKKENFVAVNCAALPENLLESELFGYVDGAFTGAKKGGKQGLFEMAHKGTLFLDEIGEIPLTLQSKLLRVLQEREVRRVGGDHVITVDVRIIAATNRNLKKMVKDGEFREDLLYRLDVLEIYVPPLRARKEDVANLFAYYLEIYGKKLSGKRPSLSKDAMELVTAYEFAGNVRELCNIAERTCVLYEGNVINKEEMRLIMFPQERGNEIDLKIMSRREESFEISDEEPVIASEAAETVRYPEPAGERFLQKSKEELVWEQETEEAQIRTALQVCNFNKKEASEILHIERTTLWRKMKKYNITE